MTQLSTVQPRHFADDITNRQISLKKEQQVESEKQEKNHVDYKIERDVNHHLTIITDEKLARLT